MSRMYLDYTDHRTRTVQEFYLLTYETRIETITKRQSTKVAQTAIASIAIQLTRSSCRLKIPRRYSRRLSKVLLPVPDADIRKFGSHSQSLCEHDHETAHRHTDPPHVAHPRSEMSRSSQQFQSTAVHFQVHSPGRLQSIYG